MNDIDRKFLLAVERGDLETLTNLLDSKYEQLDINCCDPLARNALIIAIDNENLDMVKLLIEAKIKIGDALLYAIDENFVEAVELLLDHEENTTRSSEFHSWEIDRENSTFSADLTPLILAAHRNNFEVIKILLDRGVSPIPDPHDPSCDCTCCCNARSEDCLKHSRSRINAYRALASPCLMALASPDPLLTAFQLSVKLENLANMEPEYKQDYLKLRVQCQKFAAKLLDHTRTSEELEILLNYSENSDNQECSHGYMRLARLRLAIDCKQKAFCAHPNIQELLATMWYQNLPGFRRRNPIAQVIQVILIGIMFPVYSVAYLIAPHSQLGRYIKKPFIKFICHSASYITFLIVLILASQRVEAFYSWTSVLTLFSNETSNRELEILKERFFFPAQTSARGLDSLSKIFELIPASSKKRGTLPSPIECVILVWVLSLIWAEIKQVRALGINYYRSDMWNTLDSVASAFYIATIILRLVSYAQSDEESIKVAREHWYAYDPTLLSEGLFAAATIFSALKLVYIFSVNPYLGPLQISLGRMMIDILRFSWIYMLVLFSFACGMNQLLWYYADLERHQCLNVTKYSLDQYYSNQQPLTSVLPIITTFNESRIVRDLNLTLANLSDDKIMEEELSHSLEDDSLKPPVTLDDSCKNWRHFSNVFESSQTLFWATFGLVDLENFDLTGIRQYTRFWALLMFGCYCFINVILVLNLLIAMMNHSYVKISKKSDIEWKFARTRLWMSYFDSGSTVPAPFNIVPSIKSLIRLIQRLSNYICCRAKSENQVAEMSELPTYSRRKKGCNLTEFSYGKVMRSLVRRYLVNEQRLVERKRELTEAKLNRWAKLNTFD